MFENLVRLKDCMKPSTLHHRAHWLEDIDAELPFLVIASSFVICTSIAVYLYAAVA